MLEHVVQIETKPYIEHFLPKPIFVEVSCPSASDSAMHEKSTQSRRSWCSWRWTRSFGLLRCFHQHHEKLLKTQKPRAGWDISRPRCLRSRWRSRLSSCTRRGSWSGSSWSCSRSKDFSAQQSPARHHMFLESATASSLAPGPQGRHRHGQWWCRNGSAKSCEAVKS